MIVQPNKYKTLKDFVAAAKANPGKMNYASAGAGSAAHLNGERFRLATGTKIQHIPYKGGPEGVTSVMTGETISISSRCPRRAARSRPASSRSSRCRARSARRRLPDVPTTVEAGFPNSEYDFWVGFWAPGGTPQAIVDKLNAETRQGAAGSRGEGEAQRHRRRSAADEARRSSAPS